jgi:hypothetical protein
MNGSALPPTPIGAVVMAPDPQRTQEQSIKARKHQLFEADEPDPATGPRRSFQECLRTTPADPLSTLLKALLWIIGTIVILLLIVALVTGGPRKPKPKRVTGLAPPAAPVRPG